MKVFFSLELMVWLSLTPVRMAAKLVPRGTVWTGVMQSYPNYPLYPSLWGCAEALFLSNDNLIWESHLQNYFRCSDFQINFGH